MKIRQTLLPGSKSRSGQLVHDIELRDLASELYDELSRFGWITRMKEVSQLGPIPISKKMTWSRYDYVMLQLYLHQFLQKNINSILNYSYKSKFNAASGQFHFPSRAGRIEHCCILDVMQLLTIAYNIGHFHNTFVASKAVILLTGVDDAFETAIAESSEDPQYRAAARKILDARDYQHLHILNALLMLDKCDRQSKAVGLAKDLLHAYLDRDALPADSKLRFAFQLFSTVRNVSYIAYDLQIAPTPLTLDLGDEKGMKLLFSELLSRFNDRAPATGLIRSIAKMLDDTVYYEPSTAICHHLISRKMVAQAQKLPPEVLHQYVSRCLLDRESCFNAAYPQRRDYHCDNILKLTFAPEHRDLSHSFMRALDRMNNVRVGYYERRSGQQTVLVSIRKSAQGKEKTALRIMQKAVSHLRQIKDIAPEDPRFLIAGKFFLYHLFGDRPVIFNPTIDRQVCAVCVRGKKRRVTILEELLSAGRGEPDIRYEAEFMKTRMECDPINDTSILFPCSVLVYPHTPTGTNLCELDGIVIHPMRREGQVLFLEAKNTQCDPNRGRVYLHHKFEKLGYQIPLSDVKGFVCSGYYEMTV